MKKQKKATQSKTRTPPKTTHMPTIIEEESNPPTPNNICTNDSLAPTTICTDNLNNIIEEVSNIKYTTTNNNTPTVNIIADELYTEKSTKIEKKKGKASRRRKKALSTGEIAQLK